MIEQGTTPYTYASVLCLATVDVMRYKLCKFSDPRFGTEPI